MTDTAMKKTGRIRVEGAGLYHEVRGSGPLLLILQGGDGDAGRTDDLAERLATRHTVATYDRRGLSRSPIDDPADPPTLRTHAEDVHRLLAALTDEPALVLGSSIGALIGLQLGPVRSLDHGRVGRLRSQRMPPRSWSPAR